MGTWRTGSGLAAAFLEGLDRQQVSDVVERALQRVAGSGARVDGGDGVEVVAANAVYLVAS